MFAAQLFHRDIRNDVLNEFTLGRSPLMDLRLDNDLASVSSRHCRLFCMPSVTNPSAPLQVFVEDLSTNGTHLFSGGQHELLRKSQRQLVNGDEICLVTATSRTGAAGGTELATFTFCDLQPRAMAPPPRATPRSQREPRFEEYYRKGRELGSGVCGKVYEATDRVSGLVWAVKVLELKQHAMQSTTADLLRESDIMKELGGHPNIIALKDVFLDGDALYFVMELVS